MTAQCKHPSINLFGTQMVQEKAMAPHSSSLAWKIPWKPTRWRSLVGYSPWGHEESDTTERLHFHFSLSCIGEGNGTHSSVPAWRIPGTGEPPGLPSMGSHRVEHDWSNLAAAAMSCYVSLHIKGFFSHISITVMLPRGKEWITSPTREILGKFNTHSGYKGASNSITVA